MEGCFVVSAEDCGVKGEMKGERMTKGSSLGSVVRKKLSDITNLQQRPKSLNKDEKSRPVSSTTKEHVDQLHKENLALMRLLADRNKIIELSGLELQKLRINFQKLQQQNLHLSQSNSQMLAELNLGKDRLKELQHEVECKEALLKVKNMELEEKEKKRTHHKTDKEDIPSKCEDAAEESLQGANYDKKPYNPNRRHQSRNQCPSCVIQQVAAEEMVDNKRLCSRRQSARVKSEQPEPTENLFEIEDAKFSARPLRDNPMHEDGTASSGSPTRKEEKEGKSAPRYETQELRRSLIGRPSRRAAEKIQSYKEIPVNVKMRRSE
ncbi:hypothetical protein HHK36_019226 [Tetracentron sinense]|uniref:Shugoshin C-terminal domain-containing protein n=1 Tax=Tetracentron sinense TaxID=13715 RepID=A0A835D8Z7_TETSI|nr:hypothetical protein HHK36_019226 [Tetracentron sinense]